MATAAEVIAGTAAWGVDCSDAVAGLRGLPDGCVQCCITSPPFYALRDYGTATWEGGSPDCDHKDRPRRNDGGRRDHRGVPYGPSSGTAEAQYRSVCGKCGARRVDRQIGLEDTPDAYAARLVEVFREVRRILHPSGLLLLNLGDSFAVRPQGRSDDFLARTGGNTGLNARNSRTHEYTGIGNCKPKDLLGIPWLVAFALRADGWYLRCAAPWIKDNCMPESVTDRPTTAHEYWFLLAKGPHYFWDADAVRVPHRRLWDESNGGGMARIDHEAAEARRVHQCHNHRGPYPLPNPAGRNLRTSDAFNQSLDDLIEGERAWLAHLEHVRAQGGMLLDREGDPLALCYPTFAFPGAHFATFSPHMITPLLKAATSERGCCPACRAPWARVREPDTGGTLGASWHPHADDLVTGNVKPTGQKVFKNYRRGATTGWQPSCECKTLRCPRCYLCVESLHDTQPRAVTIPPSLSENLPGVRQSLRREEDGEELRPGVQGSFAQPCGQQGQAEAAADVRELRGDVHRPAKDEGLQPGLHECDPQQDNQTADGRGCDPTLPVGGAGGSTPDVQTPDGSPLGLCADQEARSPDGHQGGVGAGAPAGNVGVSGPIPSQVGGRSPPKRRKGRQPPRKLATGDAQQTLRCGGMSALPQGISRQVTCPRCGELMESVSPDPVACVILDPFAGSGTVGLVARRLGRRFVGLDLNEQYVALARDRIESDAPLFNAPAPVPTPERTLFDSFAPEED